MEKIKKHIMNRIRFTAAVIILMAAAVLMTGNVYAASGGWETEENNDISQADYIKVNTMYSGNIMDDSDVDWYQFETDRGYIEVTFEHDYINDNNVHWVVDVMDSEENLFISYGITGKNESTSLTTLGLPAGTYYLKVEGYRGYTYDYEIEKDPYSFTVSHTASSAWEAEYNDNRSIANDIKVNQEYCGNIMDNSDVDWYRFDAEEGSVEVTFEHDYIDDTNVHWIVDVMDAEENVFISYGIEGKKESDSLTTLGLPAGTYYLKVEGYRGYTYDYEIEKSPYRFTVSNIESSVWETEYNDNRTIADPVSLGTRYYGNSMDRSDKDYYTFSLMKKEKLKFNFQNPYIDEYNYWEVSVLDEEENLIDTVLIYGSKESTSWELEYLSAGKYYVYVKPYNHSTQTYSFQIDENKIPYGTTIKSIKGGKNSITLTWKKSSDAQGYEIYRSMKKNGTYKKIKTITNKNTVKFTNKKLKKGKRYYYKIRSYKVADGTKYYSAFSSVKSAKAK